MLWLSISIVFVCVCGVAWVTFLLLAKRHTKLYPRETSSPGLAVPSPISQTQKSTQPKPSIDQVSCQSGEPPPSSAPDLKETSHWVIKAVVEASGSSGEGSIPGAQEKEREVPVNQPVVSIAETEIEETTPITPITADAEPQSVVGQNGTAFYDPLVSAAHANECHTSCPDCLRDFFNLPFHNILDWRLGLDLARLALDANAQIDLALPYWQQLIPVACPPYFTAQPGWQYVSFAGIPAGQCGNHVEIITHPLWNTNQNYFGPQLAAAYVQAVAAGHHVTFKSIFDVLRRPY